MLPVRNVTKLEYQSFVGCLVYAALPAQACKIMYTDPWVTTWDASRPSTPVLPVRNLLELVYQCLVARLIYYAINAQSWKFKYESMYGDPLVAA